MKIIKYAIMHEENRPARVRRAPEADDRGSPSQVRSWLSSGKLAEGERGRREVQRVASGRHKLELSAAITISTARGPCPPARVHVQHSRAHAGNSWVSLPSPAARLRRELGHGELCRWALVCTCMYAGSMVEWTLVECWSYVLMLLTSILDKCI